MDNSDQSYYSPPNHTTAPDNALNEHYNMDGSETSSNGSDSVQSSALDHALLESLFYNEMMMLNETSPSSSNLMVQQLHEATSSNSRELLLPAATDANTIAEKEMLLDFGVNSSTMRLQGPPTRRTDNSGVSDVTDGNPVPVESRSIAASQTSQRLPVPLAPQHALPMLDPSIPATSSSSARLLHPKPMHHTASSTPALSVEPPVSHERAKQLVDQFATLASRLGIELPNQVLQQLTTAAASNGPTITAPLPDTVNTHTHNLTATVNQTYQTQTIPSQVGIGTMNGMVPAPVTVEKLRITAEQAIAVASKKRSPEEEIDESNVSSSNANSNKPLFSKRRKKPRLSDCESKLAQLKAENEVLKQHLQNVSNKAHQIEQGKAESAKQIKLLHDSNAGPEELDKVVKEMTDTYSDYGCNRQRELSFHLEQLSRYVFYCSCY
jgi:hypothetical protein